MLFCAFLWGATSLHDVVFNEGETLIITKSSKRLVYLFIYLFIVYLICAHFIMHPEK